MILFSAYLAACFYFIIAERRALFRVYARHEMPFLIDFLFFIILFATLPFIVMGLKIKNYKGGN